GKRFDESLTPEPRLSIDSARSPTWPRIETINPSIIDSTIGSSGKKINRHRGPAPRAATSPPIEPSIVLPGLIRGASLWCPIARRVYYAAVSVNITIAKNSVNSLGARWGPASVSPIIRTPTKSPQSNATYITPNRVEDAEANADAISWGRVSPAASRAITVAAKTAMDHWGR